MTNKENYYTLDVIANKIADFEKVPTSFLFRDTRKHDVTNLRKIFHYFASKYTNLSLAKIGNYSKKWGRKTGHNHATVLYGVNKIIDWCQYDSDLRNKINLLDDEIKIIVDYNTQIHTQLNSSKKSIVKKLYSEDDVNFVQKFEDFTNLIYSGKKQHLLDVAHASANGAKSQQDKYERIYKATPKNT